MSQVYEIVTNRIIELLEKGTAPWKRPWNAMGMAVNWVTQKPYRGINVFLLEPGEYATMKQINAAGGKVKKGEKSHLVVFWKWLDIKDCGEDGETDDELIDEADETENKSKRIPFLRYYRVFEINTQCEGLQSKRLIETYEPIIKAEQLVQPYLHSPNAPELRFGSGRAYYNRFHDFISVPPLQDYKIPEEYYCTLFHEIIHSTGYDTRLSREGVRKSDYGKFGDPVYSKEELVAELGAAMLCGFAGIENTTIENSAAYIAGWLGKLKDDKKLVVQAAAQAQKAVDYLLSMGDIELYSDEINDVAAAG